MVISQQTKLPGAHTLGLLPRSIAPLLPCCLPQQAKHMTPLPLPRPLDRHYLPLGCCPLAELPSPEQTLLALGYSGHHLQHTQIPLSSVNTKAL